MSEFRAGKDVKGFIDSRDSAKGLTRRRLISIVGRAAVYTVLAEQGLGGIFALTNSKREGDKKTKYVPNQYYDGPVYIDPAHLDDLHEEPRFESHDYYANRYDKSMITKVGGVEVSGPNKGKIKVERIFTVEGPDPDGPSGKTTDWYIIPVGLKVLGLYDLEKTLYMPKPLSERTGTIIRGHGRFVAIDKIDDQVVVSSRAQGVPRTIPRSQMSVFSKE